MFTNPNTIWIEVIALVAIIMFLGFIIGRYIYKKVHHLPTGECECCKKGANKFVKEYHKTYKK